MTAISVIGLGAMGSALAHGLLQNGHALTVWNRSPERAQPLAAAGASVAPSAEAAIAASPATITCLTSYAQTHELLAGAAGALRGRTIIELSTGGMEEAEALAGMLSDNGADWLLGCIGGYPDAVGDPDLVLMMVGDPAVWDAWGDVIRELGGGSTHVGTEARMLAALFAALITTRQGFMFGMIFGGVLCRKAGIPLETYLEQMPASLAVLPAYQRYFADTVPARHYDDPPATMKTYAALLDDVLGTYRAAGATAELPQLLRDLAHSGIEAGAGDQALTALVELLGQR